MGNNKLQIDDIDFISFNKEVNYKDQNNEFKSKSAFRKTKFKTFLNFYIQNINSNSNWFDNYPITWEEFIIFLKKYFFFLFSYFPNLTLDTLFRNVNYNYNLETCFSYIIPIFFHVVSNIKNGRLDLDINDECNHNRTKLYLIEKFDDFFSAKIENKKKIKTIFIEKENAGFYKRVLFETFLYSKDFVKCNELVDRHEIKYNDDFEKINTSFQEIKKLQTETDFEKKSNNFYYNSHIHIKGNKFIVLLKSKNSKIENFGENFFEKINLHKKSTKSIEIYLKNVLTNKLYSFISNSDYINVYKLK